MIHEWVALLCFATSIYILQPRDRTTKRETAIIGTGIEAFRLTLRSELKIDIKILIFIGLCLAIAFAAIIWPRRRLSKPEQDGRNRKEGRKAKTSARPPERDLAEAALGFAHKSRGPAANCVVTLVGAV